MEEQKLTAEHANWLLKARAEIQEIPRYAPSRLREEGPPAEGEGLN
jgi:hypothetical protein